jgi:hypothetical protein
MFWRHLKRSVCTSDPFCDPEDPLPPNAGDFCFDSDSEEDRLARGQPASYAPAHTRCRFCVHVFSVLICGKYARFIRWDRDGATVRRRFDYIKEPCFLFLLALRTSESSPVRIRHIRLTRDSCGYSIHPYLLMSFAG